MIGDNVRPAEPGEFPSVVAIKKINNATTQPEDARICTGTLISMFHVLTAAHCMNDVLLYQLEIIVESVNIRTGKKHFPLWWVDYNEWAVCKEVRMEFNDNDIAIIKLTEAVHRSIKPAEISNIPNKNLYGFGAVAAGWGITQNGANPQFLQTVMLQILANTNCERKVKKAFGSKLPIHKRFLCSVGITFALLQVGDSGCPILLGNVIVGIQKATMPFPGLAVHPEKVNIHTGVYYYRQFILDIINNNYDWF